MLKVTVKDMLESGVHFGHQTRYRHPKMQSYIYGISHKINIIDLDKTLPLFADALNYISKLAANKGKILFVGTKPAAQDAIAEEAIRCGMPYVNHRWLGGMLTNYKTIRQSIKRLKDLEEMAASPMFARRTKKEALMITREIAKLEKSLGGIKNMAGLPDAIFVIDVGFEKTAINEALKLRIPIIGIVDTNNSPDNIDYVIPGNDDSGRSIKLYVSNIADVILEARGNIIEEEVVINKEEHRPLKKASKDKKKIITKKQPVVIHEKAKSPVKEAEEVAAVSEDTAEKKIVKKKTVKTTKIVKASEAKTTIEKEAE